MAGKPTALKIDAISLIFAASTNDDELIDDILTRHSDDPERIARAVAAAAALLATTGAGRTAIVNFIDHLSDRLEVKKGKAA